MVFWREQREALIEIPDLDVEGLKFIEEGLIDSFFESGFEEEFLGEVVVSGAIGLGEVAAVAKL